MTVTAKQEGEGFLVSLATTGTYEDETLSRKFYSIPEMPPPGIEGRHFWGVILGDISKFLLSDE